MLSLIAASFVLFDPIESEALEPICPAAAPYFESFEAEDIWTSYRELKECEKDPALTAFERAQLLSHQGIILSDFNELEAAQIRFEDALGLAPELAIAHRGIANIQFFKEKWIEAIVAYDRAYVAEAGASARSDISEVNGTWSVEDAQRNCPHLTLSIDVDLKAKRYTAQYSTGHQTAADVLAYGRSGLIIRYDNEERLTADGKPVVWFLHMTDSKSFVWRRADERAYTSKSQLNVRCPPE